MEIIKTKKISLSQIMNVVWMAHFYFCHPLYIIGVEKIEIIEIIL